MVKRESLQNASIYGNVDGEIGFAGSRIEGTNRRVTTRYAKVPSLINTDEDTFVKVTIKVDVHSDATDTEYSVALERAYLLALEDLSLAADRAAFAAGTIEGTFTDAA